MAGLTVIAEDVTERREAEERVHYLAHYDTLTGLPNRALFGEWLELALACAARARATRSACCTSRLDDFRWSTTRSAMPPATRCWRQFADRLRDARSRRPS